MRPDSPGHCEVCGKRLAYDGGYVRTMDDVLLCRDICAKGTTPDARATGPDDMPRMLADDRTDEDRALLFTHHAGRGAETNAMAGYFCGTCGCIDCECPPPTNIIGRKNYVGPTDTAAPENRAMTDLTKLTVRELANAYAGEVHAYMTKEEFDYAESLIAELERRCARVDGPGVPDAVKRSAEMLAAEGWDDPTEFDEDDDHDWMDRPVAILVSFVLSLAPATT